MKFVAVLLLLVGLQRPTSSPAKAEPSPSCPESQACTTYKQMVAAGDEDIKAASWVCFYSRKAPSQHEDEFFAIQPGDKNVNTLGQHPSIWVQVFRNGLSISHLGYGPTSSRDAAAPNFHHDWAVFTYDDKGDEFEFAENSYNSFSSESDLTARIVTSVRKSTGRFVEAHSTVSATEPQSPREYPGLCIHLEKK